MKKKLIVLLCLPETKPEIVTEYDQKDQYSAYGLLLSASVRNLSFNDKKAAKVSESCLI